MDRLETKTNGSTTYPEEYPQLEGNIKYLEDGREDMAVTRDKTQLPNWLMPIIISTFLLLIGFVYTTIDRRIEDKQREIDKLEHRIEIQETYMKNSRELLQAHGWDVSDDGKITKRK